jgi:hypothetical protein
VTTFDISNQISNAQNFIDNLDNNQDYTPLCYAVAQGADLFDAEGLPDFDKIFLVSFTDGFDNYSDRLWNTPDDVSDKARDKLAEKAGLTSYAIGLGETLIASNMQKLLSGEGSYITATSSSLDDVFQNIARSVISSAKNYTLVGNFPVTDETHPKYYELTVTASSSQDGSGNSLSDVLICKLVGEQFSIETPGSYATFTSPTTVGVDANDKMHVELNNLTSTYYGSTYFIQNVTVKTRMSDGQYYPDNESGQASSDISKKIAVVLVLDCSTSLSLSETREPLPPEQDAFLAMKIAANNFIDTLISTDAE